MYLVYKIYLFLQNENKFKTMHTKHTNISNEW